MSSLEGDSAESEPELVLLRSLRDWSPLYATAASLTIAAAAWYLLKELGGLLRPLVLAVLLSYAILPIYAWLRRWMSATVAVALLATVTAALLYGLALMVFSNVMSLSADLPRLITRGQRFSENVRTTLQNHLPTWLVHTTPDVPSSEGETARRVDAAVRRVADSAVGALGEAVLVGFYMLFLLIEVHRFPVRIREGFSSTHATRMMTIVESTNHKIIDYLRVKALASLCLALPQGLILWAFGVKFAAMWGLLAFIGNFIPYLGSLVALSLPVILAFLDLEPTSRAVLVTLCLLANQFINNNLIEPFMTARAVGLSPLVVLIALSFWGLSWGLVGMLLAVPLTVMLKIVWENVPLTRGLARLMEEK
jgi:AI-2 transport protein TqsA